MLTLKLYDTDFHFALIGEPIIVNELFLLNKLNNAILMINQKLSGLIMFNKKNIMLVTLLSFVISCGNNKELQIDEIINAAVKNCIKKN